MAWSSANHLSGNLKGVDINYGQTASSINWTQAKIDGVQFVYARATVGYTGTDLSTLRTDTQVVAHTANVKAAGLPIGFYHYASPDYNNGLNDAVAEAKYFADTINNTIMAPYGGGYGDLIPMLDIEAPTSMQPGLTGQMIHDWCVQFMNYFESYTGRICGIYTGKWYFADSAMMGITSAMNTVLKDRPLWVAEYVESSATLRSTGTPNSFSGWPDWKMWQFTSSSTYDQDPNFGGLTAATFNGNLDMSWGPKSIDELMPPRKPATVNYQSVSSTTTKLTWAVNIDTDIASYNVYDSTNTLLGNTSNPFYIVTVTPGTQYTFYVQAVDSVGDVSPKQSVTFTAGQSSAFASYRQMNKTRNLSNFRNLIKRR